MDKLFFNDDHLMIRDMVRDFAEAEVRPVAKEMDRKEKFPKKLVAQMGKLGLMGIIIPEKYGGAGLDMISFVTAIIELARVDASVAITMAAHTSLGSVPILLLGNEKQKQTNQSREAKQDSSKRLNNPVDKREQWQGMSRLGLQIIRRRFDVEGGYD